MVTVTIEERGCRGCRMCADVCPTQVFDMDEAAELARAARSEDCIGCLSCFYICPSQCVEVTGAHTQRPFHRIEENVALVERFLQERPASTTLTAEDWAEAGRDVASTLVALSGAVVEMMGRGARAMGRRSGTLAAGHLPELYDKSDLTGLMTRIQQRFRSCFELEFAVAGEAVDLTLSPCALHDVVRNAGETPGQAVLCQLFHEYLAGIVAAHQGNNYTCEVLTVGPSCAIRLMPK